MNKYKLTRCVLIMVTAVLFLTSCSAKPSSAEYKISGVSDKPVLTNTASKVEIKAPGGMTEIVKKGRLVMYADLNEGGFAVADCYSGHIWYSNPPDYENDDFAKGAIKRWMASLLLVNEVVLDTNTVKTKNTYVSSVMDGNVTVKTEADGILITYNFAEEGYQIPLRITLLEDSLRASIALNDIKETGEEKILSIQLLPFFGAQSKDTDGYMLIGNGSGAVINFNNGKTQGISPYTTQIYGSDPVIVPEQQQNKKEKTSLPVYGIQLASGGGMLAICEQAAGCGYIVSSVSGIQTSYNRSCFEFELRQSQTVSIGDTTSNNFRDVVCYSDSIPDGTVTARYFFLSDEEDGLGGMAKTVRNWLSENGGLSQNIGSEAPLYISALGALRRETSVLGFNVEKNEALTTVKDALQIVEELSEKKVKGIRWIYDGTGTAQLQKKLTASYKLWGGLGNTKQLLQLSENINKTGGRLYLKLPTVYFSRSGNGYSAKKLGIRTMNKATVEIPVYARNTFFPMADKESASVLQSDYAAELLTRLAESINENLNGVGIFPESYADTAYSDFGDGGYTRNMNEDQIVQTSAKVGKTIPLSEEAPMLAAIPSAADIISVPNGTTGHPLVDYSVPFYQMVLHGSVSYGGRPINADGDSRISFLLCIANGAAPHYELTAENTRLLKQSDVDSYYGSDYSYWKDTIVEQYLKYSELWDKTGSSAIVDYKRISDDLLCTVYENGVSTVVNLSDEDKTVEGVQVPAKDFIIREAM